MNRLKETILAASLALAAHSAFAALPDLGVVQGLYEGSWGEAKAEARLIAMGKGEFKLLVRKEDGEKVERAELDGKLDGKTLKLENEGGKASAAYGNGGIHGTAGAKGKLAFKRVVRESTTLGKKPASGAVILIGPGKLDNMKPSTTWQPQDPKDGSTQVPKGGMNSVPKFAGSFDAHVEFLCPLEPGKRSQGRANSGCYLPCGQEIQVLDSFGMTTYLGGGCGGLYGKKNPDPMEPIPSLKGNKENVFTLASAPPLQWQTYDIEYRVVKNDDGKEVGSLTVHHNGVKIHDGVQLNHKAGGFHFQDHGNPVRYRNIWVVETG